MVRFRGIPMFCVLLHELNLDNWRGNGRRFHGTKLQQILTFLGTMLSPLSTTELLA